MESQDPTLDVKNRHRASKEEFRARVEQVAMMLTECHSPSTIMRVLKLNYGVSRRQSSRYIRKARELLVKQVQLPVAQIVAQKHAWYMSVVSDPNVPLQIKLRAMQQDDDLLQLTRRPIVVETPPEDLMDLQVAALTIEEKRAISQAAAKVESLEERLKEEANRERQQRLLAGPRRSEDDEE